VTDTLSTRAFLFSVLGLLLLPMTARTQDLTPGAYTPAPVGVNVVTIVGSVSNGDMNFDPSLAVTNGHATIGAGAFAFNRALNLAGRTAVAGVALPYVTGRLSGELAGQPQEITRSGLSDLSMRLAVNLYGAPAMTRQEFAKHRATTVVGVSVAVGAPAGQYYPGKLINIGTNRWAIKPEIGIMRTRGRWTIEGDFGTVFFQDNTNFSNGKTRGQTPVATIQGHLIYTFRPGLWLASDGNYWHGGTVTSNGVEIARRQQNSRLGATLAVPVRRQQLRIAYSFGAFTTIGGDFQSIGVSYSYAWMGRP